MIELIIPFVAFVFVLQFFSIIYHKKISSNFVSQNLDGEGL